MKTQKLYQVRGTINATALRAKLLEQYYSALEYKTEVFTTASGATIEEAVQNACLKLNISAR